MQLVHLSLTNFRNFIRLEMEFPPGPTLVVGPNAQGKTSLLEAIDYLVAAESPRAGSDRELINFLVAREPEAFARIVAEFRRSDRAAHRASHPEGDPVGDRAAHRASHPGGDPAGDRPQRIEVRLVAEAPRPEGEARLQKEILLNGVRRRAADLAGQLNAVLFLPDDLRVIEGPPAERRRLLDQTLAQADPVYAGALAEYGRLLTQRNALLRQAQERLFDARQLDPWDAQLVDFAVQLIRGRAVALTELERLAGPIHETLTRGREQLRLAYQGRVPSPLRGDRRSFFRPGWTTRLSPGVASKPGPSVLTGTLRVGGEQMGGGRPHPPMNPLPSSEAQRSSGSRKPIRVSVRRTPSSLWTSFVRVSMRAVGSFACTLAMRLNWPGIS